MTIKLIVFLVLINNLVVINGNSRYCVNQETCDTCLDQHSSCAWCTDRDFDMRRVRCMTESDLKAANCRSEFIKVNKYAPIELKKDNVLQDFNKDLDAVQIKPQNVKMMLRKGREQSVKLTYKPAKNYPLDLYYLMDLTYTMKDDKETLVKMGGSLLDAMKNLTENFRLGFGSFSDKPIMPYILAGTETNPCSIVNEVCEPAYGFKHKLALTEDVQQFILKVNGSDITGNSDNMEGGFDALMQILVCNDIGWNNKTRKIVVFASDGPFHLAGDGKLGGIVKKNDKQCHLSEDGDYLKSLEYDYPSLEEIYRELLKTKVNVIFAVTQEVNYQYDQVRELMQELTSVGTLKSDSSNILQLVENGYKEVVKRAQFSDNAPNYIKVNYKTDCGGKYDTPQDLSHCDNIEIGNEYEFEIQIYLQNYPEDLTKALKIRIEESGLSEGLDIDIEIDYPCTSCEKMPGEKASPLCLRQGEFKCGACHCNSGWEGKICECNLQDYTSTKELDNDCRELITNGNDTELGTMCTDRGECFCGSCYCNSNYAGKYCQCDKCPIIKGLECGGIDRAICNCGVCECLPAWSGPSCDCSSSETNCIAPDTKSSDIGKVCSGHGNCECNRCECDNSYFGKFCEISVGNETQSSLCIFYEPCVQCIINRKLGKECLDYNEKCISRTGDLYQSEFYDDISDETIKCIARVKYEDDICEYRFAYESDSEHQTHLKIENTSCPPINAATLATYSVLAIMFATFLLGMIFLIIFKVNIILADKREFAKFEEEREKHTLYKFESPLYKSPVTTFIVPNHDDGRHSFEMK